MPQLQRFRLPDVGEGLTEGEILQWLVAVGDTVVVNQPLVEVETAKAAVELPSPWAGVVTELLAQVGETVEVGVPIITIDTQPGGDAAPATPSAPEREPEPEPRQPSTVASSAAGPDPSTPAGARQLAATEFVPAPRSGRAVRTGRSPATTCSARPPAVPPALASS
jgi:pyruvate dehydrogenase E2 component (dihydrolipoamide acetyltransferase)